MRAGVNFGMLIWFEFNRKEIKFLCKGVLIGMLRVAVCVYFQALGFDSEEA